jgi:hypothetical protein
MPELLVGTPGLQIVLRSTLHRPRCEFSRSPQPSFTIRLIRHFDLLDGQSEHDFSVHDPTSHITNTGRIIEDMEIKMRGQLQEVCRSFYFLPFPLFRQGHRPFVVTIPAHDIYPSFSSYILHASADAQHRALVGPNHHRKYSLSDPTNKVARQNICLFQASHEHVPDSPPRHPVLISG